MPTLEAGELQRFAGELLERGGFARDDGEAIADLLVWANLRGIDSHGVLRIPRYIEMLELGIVKSDHRMRIVHEFGAVKVLDADRAPGAVAMARALEDAAILADSHGIGWCGVRDTSHAGAIGYFAQKLTDRGKIAIVMTASKPLMTYYGAKGEALSTNPLAIGVPQSDDRPPILLDMSTAAVALGKIMAAKDRNEPIPTGWGVDANGADTTDPKRVAAVLPMAGAKGSGLSLMIELLCSVLNGNPTIAPALSKQDGGGFNGLVLAINTEAFGDPNEFLRNTRTLADAIHNLVPAEGHDRVLLPGERGHEAEIARLRDGVPIAPGTAKRLIECADKFDLPVPPPLQSRQAFQ